MSGPTRASRHRTGMLPAKTEQRRCVLEARQSDGLGRSRIAVRRRGCARWLIGREPGCKSTHCIRATNLAGPCNQVQKRAEKCNAHKYALRVPGQLCAGPERYAPRCLSRPFAALGRLAAGERPVARTLINDPLMDISTGPERAKAAAVKILVNTNYLCREQCHPKCTKTSRCRRHNRRLPSRCLQGPRAQE